MYVLFEEWVEKYETRKNFVHGISPFINTATK